MVSETILYPAYRNRLDRLLGLQCTLAGRRTREPAAGKVVLEFLGRRINVRKALRTCGLFTPEEKRVPASIRSEEHTSELQSLMRISYAVFCLKKKTTNT